MGLLYVGNTNNHLLLPDETLALVYESVLEASKITGFITICSWFEEKSRYVAVDAVRFFPTDPVDDTKEIDHGNYVLGLKAVFDNEPVPNPDPKAVENLIDLIEEHDGWLILDDHDRIITDPDTIKKTRANALRYDAWAWIDLI